MVSKIKKQQFESLIWVLSNPHRRRILKECSKVDIGFNTEPKFHSFGILENLLGKSHSFVQKHIKILERAGLIRIFDYNPKLIKERRRGRPTIRLLTPFVTKDKVDEIDKEIKDIQELIKNVHKSTIKKLPYYKKATHKPKTQQK